MKIINDDINILESITKKNRLSRIIFMCLGLFLVALLYNSFVVPNHIVYGGVGGVAIILNNAFGISTTVAINAITIVFIIASFIILGAKKTSYSLIGFIVYDIMINITTPLAQHVNLQFDSFLFSVVLYSALMGIGYGIVYRTGFNTGGSDILLSILQHYFKLPNSAISNVMNGVVILIGASIFGIVNSLYAVIFLKVCNFVSDHVLIGISNSKICLITTKQKDKLEKFISEELEVGYTLLDSTNGVGILPKSIIMCVIPSDRFYELKGYLMHIDKRAKLISNDCYAVVGGSTNALLSIYN